MSKKEQNSKSIKSLYLLDVLHKRIVKGHTRLVGSMRTVVIPVPNDKWKKMDQQKTAKVDGNKTGRMKR